LNCSEPVGRATGLPFVILVMTMRIIHFPIGQSLGKVYLPSGEAINDWAEFAEAQGDVAVPSNLEVRLEVSKVGAFDLSPLSKIGPDDIQVLELSSINVGDSEIKHLQHLSGLRGLALWETDIGDVALSYISKLVALRWLDIGDTKITNNGLIYLRSLVSLRQLSLLNTQIGDEGLAHLIELRNLEYLDLMGTKVSDASVNTLVRLKAIKSLRIYDTKISKAGYLEIKKALPGCQVKYRHYYHP
jgi:Leucine-rich repeat (LRR) protein